MTEQTGDQPVTQKGLPPGVTATDLDEGQTTQGAPKAPEIAQAPAKVEEKTPETDDKNKTEETPDPAAKTEEEQPPKEGEEAPVDEKVEYVEYGDEAADAAVSMFKEAGVPAEEAAKFFQPVLDTGDISKIDLKGLTEKLGKEKATAVMALAKEYYNRQMSEAQVTVNAVLEVAGGKENFDKIAAWARAEADKNPEFAKELVAFNQMINGSTYGAKLAAMDLKKRYEAAPNNKALGNTYVHGDKSPSIGVDLQPLSRDEYLKQVKEAQEKGDHRRVAQLRTQRLHTRKTERK